MSFQKFLGVCAKGIKRKVQRMSVETKRLLIIALMAIIVGGIFGGSIGKSAEKKRSEAKVAEASAEVEAREEKKRQAIEKELYDLKETLQDTKVELPWNLVLVNYQNPMEEKYVPELTELEPGYSVDTRIADATREMLTDAKKAGMQILICSAYRSVERQEQVFDQSMKERVKSGMGYWDAYKETSMNVAGPGTSEHALGLALDLISNQYTELDEGLENTKEAEWLAENCYKYGFILRYPPEKTSITGIIYEPWHYRYVGVEDAKKITELGVTLEEYLQGYYEPEGEQ